MIRLRNAPLLAPRWLLRNPQHSVPLLLLALYFGVWLAAPRQSQKFAPVPLSSSAPAVAPESFLSSAAPPLDLSAREQTLTGYTKERTLRFREGRNRWRVEQWSGDAGVRVKFYCNRRFVHEEGAYYLSIGRMPLKSRFPLIALRTSGFSAVGQTKSFYTMRHGKVSLLLELDSWNRGPFFRNYDRNGNPEWITDDFDFNSASHDWGDHLYIHKLQPNGDLKTVKVMPNTAHCHTEGVFPADAVHWLD